MQNRSKHRHALLALAIVSTLVSGQTLPAVQATDSTGKLDGSFGTGGISDVRGNVVVVEPNGEIYVAGGKGVGRLHSDGTLDGSFGTGGFAINDNDAFFGNSVAVGPEGAIVMAGLALFPGRPFDSALTRFLSDGTLDTGFGTGGTVIMDVSGDDLTDRWTAVAVQPDGKIVVAGESIITGVFDSSFALARYNTDGTLDASFGTGGIVTSDLGASLTSAFSVAIQPDGKIVAAGTTFINDFDFALARYNSDGTLDASFGRAGQSSPISRASAAAKTGRFPLPYSRMGRLWRRGRPLSTQASPSRWRATTAMARSTPASARVAL